MAAITAEDFAARLKRVSSDEFEGRKPGTLGERLTTAWLVDQFTQMGVKPGNKGEWLQTVPMVDARVNEQDKVKLTVKAANDASADFAFNTDMVVGSLDNTPSIDLENSDIVFVGYGVNAPEQNWNDFAGLDVTGKTLIVLVNDPGWGNQDANLFKGRTLTYYGRWVYKYEEAARQGAAATFIVHDTDAAAYPWQVVQNSWGGDRQSLPSSEDPAPRLKVAGWLTTDAARRLFTTAGKDFDALKASADLPGFKPSELGATLSTTFTSSVKTSSSQNVIGMIKGSERPDEVVVYSAHWDHFGKDESLSGDQILNGAVDNGSGIAGLLEIAEAFSKQST
ncbi:MAG: M28 family metallopeptidase, partial [Dokdonella sp.]